MIKLEELTRNTEKAAEFFADKLAFTLGPVELKKLHETNPDGIQIIDVRHADVYMKSHIPDAISFRRTIFHIHHHLSKDKINIVYCYNEDCHLAARWQKPGRDGLSVMGCKADLNHGEKKTLIW